MESDYSEEDTSYEASQEEEEGHQEANLLETGDKVGGIKGFYGKGFDRRFKMSYGAYTTFY